MKLIVENKENLRSDKVLPMNAFFEETLNLEKTMHEDTSLNSKTWLKYAQWVDELYKAMRESMPSPLA